jgi:coproporphyrinogen III oxidase-like Fe-S oxidoreductase
MARKFGAAWTQFGGSLEWAATAGLVRRDDGRLQLTRRGRRLANEVFVRLMEPELV